MDFFFINIENNRKTRAILTLIIGIGNFILNFQKLKAALQNTFCGLKLKLLDFAGDETHRGNMTTINLNTIDKRLQQHVMHSFCDELVMNKKDKLLYFPTENTMGKEDKGIQYLQKEIMSTAEELRPIMGREIPYLW